MSKKLAVVGGDLLYRAYGSDSDIVFREAIGYMGSLEDQKIISNMKFGDSLTKGAILLDENTNFVDFPPENNFSVVFGQDEKLHKFILDKKIKSFDQSSYLVFTVDVPENFNVPLGFKKRFPHLETLIYDIN